MFSKRFFLCLLSVGVLSAPIVACDDDDNDTVKMDEYVNDKPCDAKRPGDACGGGKICNGGLLCVAPLSSSDAACNGKYVGYACGTNSKCDASGACVSKGSVVVDPCNGKAVGAYCGNKKVCDASNSCVAALSGGDASCEGKYVGYACDANGGKCDASAKCAGGSVVDPCKNLEAGSVCGLTKVCDANHTCVEGLSGGDPECIGKYVGYACDVNGGKCDASAKCTAAGPGETCDGKAAGDRCGDGKVCDIRLRCSLTLSGGDASCEGKYVGYPCDPSDNAMLCNPYGECLGGDPPLPGCDVLGVGADCGSGWVCDASLSCVAPLKGGDAACEGKYVGYACDANGGKCDASAKCAAESAPKLIRYNGSDAGHKNANISADSLRDFVKGQYDLNFDLLRDGEEQFQGKNAMISTFSIQTVLGMAYSGAAGNTKSQIASALNFGDDANDALNKINTEVLARQLPAQSGNDWNIGAVEVKTSNNLYYAVDVYDWKDSWLKVLDHSYDAGITEMNCAADPEAARNYINNIVSNDTNQRIKELLPDGSVSELTTAVLTNSIYLKAPWHVNLEVAETKLDFHVGDSVANVDALSIHKKDLNYLKSADYSAVVVPLRDDTFQVLFIVPDSGKYDAVWSSLNGDVVTDILSNLRSTLIDLTYPQIEFDTSLALRDLLVARGMVDAFGNADFSEMKSDDKPLSVSQIYHKSFIAMNVYGVEAAAATALLMEGATPDEPIELDIDRPYIFVIYETGTKSPLFVGRVLDPRIKD